MKRYGLLKCFPAGWYGQSGNVCLEECHAASLADAITQLQPRCPVPLDANGYAKQGTLTFTIAEFLSA